MTSASEMSQLALWKLPVHGSDEDEEEPNSHLEFYQWIATVRMLSPWEFPSDPVSESLSRCSQ